MATAVEMLRERGIEEMSLNFATAARFIHSPHNRIERALGRLCGKLDRFFQIESLYRFNVKFFPRWGSALSRLRRYVRSAAGRASLNVG